MIERNVLKQEEGGRCHLPTEVKGRPGLQGGGGGVVCFLVEGGKKGGGVCTHLSTWETDSGDILNCRHTNSPVTLLPVTAEECCRWDYFKLPTGIESPHPLSPSFAPSLALSLPPFPFFNRLTIS